MVGRLLGDKSSEGIDYRGSGVNIFRAFHDACIFTAHGFVSGKPTVPDYF